MARKFRRKFAVGVRIMSSYYLRDASGWIRTARAGEYKTEDGRFKAILKEKQGWLLVTDTKTNKRRIADSVQWLNVTRLLMETSA